MTQQGSTIATPARLPTNDEPEVSVVMPVYNGAAFLDRSLSALSHTTGVAWECIVVDDGSTDGSADVARKWGARVVPVPLGRGGPGCARNEGARVAHAPLLVFLDADVLARPDTLSEFARLFAADASLCAAFGAYDAEPDVREHLSEYRNLLHHFVHQEGSEIASTFWAGCGAIRRDEFLAIGGFNPAYRRPSIEDIELGYRLRASGREIRLAKHIQVKHLKRWTLVSLLKTDIFDRALPWTQLIARSGHLPRDLNLRLAGRLSAVSVYVLAGCLLLALVQPWALLGVIVSLTLLLLLNRGLYAFFLAERGWWFLIRAMPMHWLYFAYSALVFGVGVILARLGMRGRRLGLTTLPPLHPLHTRYLHPHHNPPSDPDASRA
jgi:glycosyltransferase involved in cell wall biosynthesis